MTYDWRRPNEVARVEFVHRKLEELGRSMGATHVWRAPPSPGSPISHHQGGTRMGGDTTTSMVNRYGQSWDIPNLFIVGSSTFPTSAGFNPPRPRRSFTSSNRRGSHAQLPARASAKHRHIAQASH